jgi:hypothetical protein
MLEKKIQKVHIYFFLKKKKTILFEKYVASSLRVSFFRCCHQ